MQLNSLAFPTPARQEYTRVRDKPELIVEKLMSLQAEKLTSLLVDK